MYTGNIRNYRNGNNQLVVEVIQATLSEADRQWLPTDKDGTNYTASFAGWFYEHHVGCASSKRGALADLAEQSQTTVRWIEGNCEIRESES